MSLKFVLRDRQAIRLANRWLFRILVRGEFPRQADIDKLFRYLETRIVNESLTEKKYFVEFEILIVHPSRGTQRKGIPETEMSPRSAITAARRPLWPRQIALFLIDELERVHNRPFAYTGPRRLLWNLARSPQTIRVLTRAQVLVVRQTVATDTRKLPLPLRSQFAFSHAADFVSRLVADQASATNEPQKILRATPRLRDSNSSGGAMHPIEKLAYQNLRSLFALLTAFPRPVIVAWLHTRLSGTSLMCITQALLGDDEQTPGYLTRIEQRKLSNEQDSLLPIQKLDQFQSRCSSVLTDVHVLHERFIVKNRYLVVTETAATLQNKPSAGLWPFVYHSPKHEDIALLLTNVSETIEVSEAIAGFGRVDSNWFHFLVETLPRILRACEIAPEGVPILTQRQLVKAGEELLRKVTGRQLMPICHSKLKVSRLYVAEGVSSTFDAPGVSPIVGHWDREALQAVRERVLESFSIPASPHKKVCLLRNSEYRRILNLRRIRRVLAEEGFEFVDMSKLSVTEQISVVRHAETIVLQGGAAMTNLMFARDSTKVIGLVGSFGQQDRYWSGFLSCFGIAGEFVVGVPLRNDRFSPVHEHFSVPVTELASALRG